MSALDPIRRDPLAPASAGTPESEAGLPEEPIAKRSGRDELESNGNASALTHAPIAERSVYPAAPIAAAAPAAVSAATRNEGRFSVLGYPAYRRVLVAQFISNCGNWMELIGLQMLVATLTQSLVWMGYLGAAQLLPILFLGTLGGLVADRVDRRRLLIFTQVLLMLVAVGVCVVAFVPWTPGDLTPVYLFVGLGALQGVVMAFNMPAWQVLTPRLVPREELTQAITVNGIQFNLARVVGPALGGLLMGTVGYKPLFVINALSFLAVVLAVRLTPDNPPPPHDGKSPWRQIADGCRFIFGHRGPLAVFLASFVMSALAAPLVRFLSMFVIDVYGQSQQVADKTVGLLLAVQGVGAVIGGLTLRWLPPWYPKHHLIPVAVAGNGLFITAFALAASPAWGFAFMLPIGFFWIWAFNQSWAAMQHLCPDHMRGRVLAIFNVASFGATAFGALAGGWMGEALHGAAIPLVGTVSKAMSTQAAVGGLSLLLLLAGFVMLLFRTPEVDGLPRLPVPPRARLDLVNAVLAREHRPE